MKKRREKDGKKVNKRIQSEGRDEEKSGRSETRKQKHQRAGRARHNGALLWATLKIRIDEGQTLPDTNRVEGRRRARERFGDT